MHGSASFIWGGKRGAAKGSPCTGKAAYGSTLPSSRAQPPSCALTAAPSGGACGAALRPRAGAPKLLWRAFGGPAAASLKGPKAYLTMFASVAYFA